MRLLTVMVTYNRLELTKETLTSYADTVEGHHFFVVVDNNSTDGTQEYLKEMRAAGIIDLLILNPENYYPGKATNIGWEEGMKLYDPAYLMRLDNDMHLEIGWAKKAREYFEALPFLGQLGLDHDAIKEAPQHMLLQENGMVVNQWPGNVGGTMIIKRELWDKGLRYDEKPWFHTGGANPTPQEDVRMSLAVQGLGYQVGHMTDKMAWTVVQPSDWKNNPEYYRKTAESRGYDFDKLAGER